MRQKPFFIFLLLLISALAFADIQIVAGPYLQNPTEDGISIIWLTNTKAYGEVELETAVGISRHYSCEDGLRGAYTTLHKVRISGLEAGTQYRYRVSAKEITSFQPYKVAFGKTIVSEWFRCSTLSAATNEASFVVFNDIHEKPEIVENLLSHHNEGAFDLAFINGDYFHHLEDETQLVEILLKHLDGWSAASTPFLLVRGNHETRGKFARELKNYLDFPGGRYYFSLRQGPLHIIVLDSGEDKEDNHWAYHGLTDFDSYRTREAAWLKEQLESQSFKSAAFRIVIVHMPLFYDKMGHGMQDCQDKFAPLLNGNIDLMIAGHTHKRAVLRPNEKHGYPVFIGGSPKNGEGTMISVKADKKALKLLVTGEDGKILESFIIEK